MQAQLSFKWSLLALLSLKFHSIQVSKQIKSQISRKAIPKCTQWLTLTTLAKWWIFKALIGILIKFESSANQENDLLILFNFHKTIQLTFQLFFFTSLKKTVSCDTMCLQILHSYFFDFIILRFFSAKDICAFYEFLNRAFCYHSNYWFRKLDYN